MKPDDCKRAEEAAAAGDAIFDARVAEQSRGEACPVCHGERVIPRKPPSLLSGRCPRCKGSGRYEGEVPAVPPGGGAGASDAELERLYYRSVAAVQEAFRPGQSAVDSGRIARRALYNAGRASRSAEVAKYEEFVEWVQANAWRWGDAVIENRIAELRKALKPGGKDEER